LLEIQNWYKIKTEIIFLKIEMSSERELLCEQVIKENGNFKIVRRWWRGWYPELGRLGFGLQGKETIQEITVIKASKTIEVKRAKNE